MAFRKVLNKKKSMEGLSAKSICEFLLPTNCLPLMTMILHYYDISMLWYWMLYIVLENREFDAHLDLSVNWNVLRDRSHWTVVAFCTEIVLLSELHFLYSDREQIEERRKDKWIFCHLDDRKGCLFFCFSISRSAALR